MFLLPGIYFHCIDPRLGDIDLAVVDEVEDGLELSVFDSPEVEERVVVGITAENVSEERTAGRDDHFVSLNLILIRHQSHIEKILFISYFFKGPT